MVNNKKFETVIFHHIPKTAGTTFYSIIETQLPKSEIYTINGNQLEHEKSLEKFKNLTKSDLANIKILKGHNVYGLDQFFAQDCTYFAIIRKPEQRFVSSYYSMLRGKQELPERIDFIANRVPLDEYIRRGDLYFGHNSLCKIIINCRDKNFEITREYFNSIKESLTKNFSLIGLTESFDETVVLANRTFNWNIKFYQRKNEAQNYIKEELDPEYYKLYKKMNPFDVELYEFIEALFKKKIEEYGSGFLKDLSLLKRLNRRKNAKIALVNSVKKKLKFLLGR